MEPIHPEPDAYVRESDVPLLNRLAIESVTAGARRMAVALYVVATMGLLLWLWYVWKTIDAMQGDGSSNGGFGGFGDGSPTVGDYITATGQYWSFLVFGTLVAGLASLLRLLAAHAGNAVGVDVADVAVGDPLSEVDGGQDPQP